MSLTILSPQQLFGRFVQSVQSAFSTTSQKRPTNFGENSMIGAIGSAVTATSLTLQGQAEFQVAICRAATSTGPDLWSFCNDYFNAAGEPEAPLPAQSGSGALLFVRNQAAPNGGVVIAVGTVVQNQPIPPQAAVQYEVIADLTNPNFSANLNGYLIPQGQFSISATVAAVVPGSDSNVLAGALQTIVTPGVPADFITQPNDITNGVPQETDPQLRVRFQKFISSLATANENAISNAILSATPGCSFSINEQVDPNNLPKGAFFTVVADDGTGAIPPQTISDVTTAVNAVRAEGLSFIVVAPQNVPITVTVSGTIVAPSFDAPTVRAAIQAAIIAFVNAQGVGGSGYGGIIVGEVGKVSYVDVVEVVQGFQGTDPSQGLTSYASVLVNGNRNDVPISNFQLPRANSSGVVVS